MAQGAQRWSGEEDRGRAEGEGPLTPIQQWFFEREPQERDHWNQSFLFSIPAGLELAALQGAVLKLICLDVSTLLKSR